MKGTKAIFAVCLVLLTFGGTFATEDYDAARAAIRRGVTTSTQNSNRQKTNTAVDLTKKTSISRQTNIPEETTPNVRERAQKQRTTTSGPNVSRGSTSRNTSTENVSARNTSSNIASRATATKKIATTPVTSVSRTGTNTKLLGRTVQNTTQPVRTPARQTGVKRTSSARSATMPQETLELRNQIMNSNTKECRDIYYKCMDEFCANKDSQLKRCACSSRLHEFDNAKKQLANAEEKMLNFSQRLLTVSMDAKDAAALNVATEGELAFNAKDKSDSQNILNEISKKLNKTFDNESFDRNMTAISLSLNEDAAFDNVDSMMGASTTLKTGTELYAAALPVCREMAAEVCTPDQLSIAESGYQMMIEQDCNTVKKSYQSQADQAREKIRESSALLDMSRLNVYQDKNSDDILTCKKKMLDMLTNSSVCGTNLIKCLDTTGQYIDPTTGEAFLTTNLANLNYLITRPSANQTWVGMPGNEKFVSYLNSKRQYLAPATEHCQDISDYVWNDFIEDALSQIKLAQDAKLEEVRQSCTTLTTQCLSDTAKTLEDFDARALSTFGVVADVTVNAMCTDIKTACTALLQATDGDVDWTSGMTEIATDKTYDTILKTCREVGRACIIQSCKSISGNFGLCENIETSVNRKSIINRTACWQEVVDCIADAGDDSINNIMDQLVKRGTITATQNTSLGEVPAYSFYKTLYYTNNKEIYDFTEILNSGNQGSHAEVCVDDWPTDTPEDEKWEHDEDGNKTIAKTGNQRHNCIYDICIASEKCYDLNDTSLACKTCRIAEKIWGNCEVVPSTPLGTMTHNRIKKPVNEEDSTLLYWFALNTGTDQMADSCRDTSCGPGYLMDPSNGLCYPESQFTADGGRCSITAFDTPTALEKNCCTADTTDSWFNCCTNGTVDIKIKQYDNTTNTDYVIMSDLIKDGNGKTTDITSNSLQICLPEGTKSAELVMTFSFDEGRTNEYYTDSGTYLLICLDGTVISKTTDATFECKDGTYIVVNRDTGVYYTPTNTGELYPMQYYHRANGDQECKLQYNTTNKSWDWISSITTACNGILPGKEDQSSNNAHKIKW